MILQALYEYYTAMAAQGKMARHGWNPVKVSFALLIDEQGTLLDVLRLKEKELRGKYKQRPAMMDEMDKL